MNTGQNAHEIVAVGGGRQLGEGLGWNSELGITVEATVYKTQCLVRILLKAISNCSSDLFLIF
jgi:hypothetical protein